MVVFMRDLVFKTFNIIQYFLANFYHLFQETTSYCPTNKKPIATVIQVSTKYVCHSRT
jgi:hypothetical protein